MTLNEQLSGITSSIPRPKIAGVLLFNDDKKTTKSEANYHQVSDNTRQRCGNCTHFKDSSCDIVAGAIEPNYVSDYYEPKIKSVK